VGDARGLLRIVHCIGGWPDGLETGGGLKRQILTRLRMRMKGREGGQGGQRTKPSLT
jgi:hypothetical protein